MDKIEALAKIIDESRNIVFFGGAGVSTESGVPDFRSKDGLYNKPDVRFEGYSPEYLLSHTCLVNEPKVFFEFYRQKMDARNVAPNFAHLFLAKLERLGKLKAVVTQNIDGLHQQAGSKTVYELHGSIRRAACVKCSAQYNIDFVMKNVPVPHCERCGGIVKPDVVLYGEQLDDEVIANSIRAISDADTLIVGGTSLIVYPAAGLIDYFRGDNLILINKTATRADADAQLVIRDNIGVTLARAVELLA